MLPATGTTVRFFRKLYGIETQYMYEGLLQRQNYYDYEQGRSDTTVENFIQFCLRLGGPLADIEEHYLTHQLLTIEEIALLEEFDVAFMKDDRSALQQLCPHLQQAYQRSSFLIYHRYAQIATILTAPHPQEQLQQLYDQLLNTKKFLLLDTKVLYYLFDCFPLSHQLELLTHFIDSANPYSGQRLRNARVGHDIPDLALKCLIAALEANDSAAFRQSYHLLKQLSPREHELRPFFAAQLLACFPAEWSTTVPETLSRCFRLCMWADEADTLHALDDFWRLLLSHQPLLTEVLS